MNTEKHTELLMDFLVSDAYLQDPQRLNAFLQQNPACEPVWEEMKVGWDALDTDVQVPLMPDRFEDFDLQQAERSTQKEAITIRIPRWSLAAATLLLGLAAGLLWPRADRSDEISLLTAELQKTRLSMQVLYLQSPDAGERMYAASLVDQLPMTEITTDAWLNVLQADPSLSVRMAALDVLTRKEISNSLRKRLVLAMGAQDSPMLRIEMAELAQTHKWKEALPVLKHWQEDVNSPPPLKKALEKVISKLSLNA